MNLLQWLGSFYRQGGSSATGQWATAKWFTVLRGKRSHRSLCDMRNTWKLVIAGSKVNGASTMHEGQQSIGIIRNNLNNFLIRKRGICYLNFSFLSDEIITYILY
jgi:hypothetical protein